VLCVVLPWVGISRPSVTMMSMVYLSSRPLSQSELDAEEICPGLSLEVSGIAGVEGRCMLFPDVLQERPYLDYDMVLGIV
jgi:hypothetical protein